VLNDQGAPVETITNSDIVGPWDLTLKSSAASAEIFVSNALGGNTRTDHGVPVAGQCTIVLLDLALNATSAPTLTSSTVLERITRGRPTRPRWCWPQLVSPWGTTGPFTWTTLTNTVSRIANALTRTSPVGEKATTISSGGALSAPLGMTMAPNGDLITVNGNNGKAVGINPAGKQLATRTLVRNGAVTYSGSSLRQPGRASCLSTTATTLSTSTRPDCIPFSRSASCCAAPPPAADRTGSWAGRTRARNNRFLPPLGSRESLTLCCQHPNASPFRRALESKPPGNGFLRSPGELAATGQTNWHEIAQRPARSRRSRPQHGSASGTHLQS
jgi:hypothetical protein